MRGYSLLELVIALALLGFALAGLRLGVFGLSHGNAHRTAHGALQRLAAQQFLLLAGKLLLDQSRLDITLRRQVSGH